MKINHLIGFCIVLLLGGYVLNESRAQESSVLFSALGDYGDGSGEQGAVAALVNSWNADFIIGAGDNRYGSISYDTAIGQFYCDSMKDAQSGSFCAGGTSLSNAFFPVPGNHDYTDGGGITEYLDYFVLPGDGIASSGSSGNERYYDFVVGPVHFFGIDSQAARNSSTEMGLQRSWLEQAVKASTATWKVVYMHHAPLSSARHGSHPELQWSFADYGVDAVIAGHDHTYERLNADGIPYFVTGLGGRSIYSFDRDVLSNSEVRYNHEYGAMRVLANESNMTFEFVNTNDELIDQFVYRGRFSPNDNSVAGFSAIKEGLKATFINNSPFKEISSVSWRWDFGDGQSSKNQRPIHVYNSYGSYRVSLTVIDSNGASHSYSREITLKDPTTIPSYLPAIHLLMLR